MKAKVLFVALAWALVISVLHVWLNVGWSKVAQSMGGLFGERRQELVVGFLPVT